MKRRKFLKYPNFKANRPFIPRAPLTQPELEEILRIATKKHLRFTTALRWLIWKGVRQYQWEEVQYENAKIKKEKLRLEALEKAKVD